MLYKSKTFELLELLDIVGFIVGMFLWVLFMGQSGHFYSCCDYIGLLGTGFMQVLYLGRAPRTKETLPDFLKWRRVTRHSLVFRGLMGSQRTPGFGASQKQHFLGSNYKVIANFNIKKSQDERLKCIN